MAYEVVMSYHLHMPSYFLGTFTEYPFLAVYPCRETTLCFKRRKMFKGFQERIPILLILHDAYNQDKYLLTVFTQEVFVERSFSF